MTPEERRAALELEAERIIARLDQLAKDIDGDPDSWLGIQEQMGGDVAEVVINKPLAEARQQAATLAGIVRTLDGTVPAEAPAAPTGPDPGEQARKARAERLAAAKAAGLIQVVQNERWPLA